MADFTPKKWDDASIPDAASFSAGNKLMGLVGSAVTRFPRSVFDALYSALVHASRHKHGGADEIATATPAANEIPKATAGGKLDSWISDAAAGVKGLVELDGQLGGTAASPDVRGLRETGGPTLLTAGAIADGEVLGRSGSNIVGVPTADLSVEGAKYHPDRSPGAIFAAEEFLTPGSFDLTWRWANQGAATDVSEIGTGMLTAPSTGTSADNYRVRWIDSPGAVDWVLTSKLHPQYHGNSNQAGLLILVTGSEAAPTLLHRFMVYRSSSGYVLHYGAMTNYATASTTFADAAINTSGGGFLAPIYLQMRYIAGTKAFSCHYSFDGMTWTQWDGTQTLSTDPVSVGRFASSSSATLHCSVRYRFFRVRTDATGIASPYPCGS